ncbi:MAG: TetR family transcriptional regulator [Micrococcaceae bacterium]
MRRTAEDAEKTRIELLKAAIFTFEEKGWAGATFEAIANKAGVTRGAINHHFRNKQVLLVESLEWGWKDFADKIFSRPAKNTEDFIKNLLNDYVELLQKNSEFRALAYATIMISPQVVGVGYEKDDEFSYWRARIVNSIKEKETALKAETIANIVLTLLNGFTVTAVIDKKNIPSQKELNAAFSKVTSALLAET